MRLAYADPPYVGCAKYYEHPDSGLYDTVVGHAALLDRLANNYDGWAMSASAASLQQLLAFAPATVRVASWTKNWVPWKGQQVEWTWEPVLFVRARSAGGPRTVDHLVEPSTQKRGLVGAKPERFCHWILDLMGFLPGDDVDDLFPGTGVMGRVYRGRDLWDDEQALAGGSR